MLCNSVRAVFVYCSHTCKFPSVGLLGCCVNRNLFAESTFVSRPCLSCVVCRSLGRGAVGPPTAFPRTVRRVPLVSCLDRRGCHSVQDDLVTKSQPLCVLVGVVTSCVLCARVRGRVSRSCATENTYTPPRLEALFKLSVVAILRHLYRSLQHLRVYPKPFRTRSFLLSAVSRLLRSFFV